MKGEVLTPELSMDHPLGLWHVLYVACQKQEEKVMNRDVNVYLPHDTPTIPRCYKFSLTYKEHNRQYNRLFTSRLNHLTPLSWDLCPASFPPCTKIITLSY